MLGLVLHNHPGCSEAIPDIFVIPFAFFQHCRINHANLTDEQSDKHIEIEKFIHYQTLALVIYKAFDSDLILKCEPLVQLKCF